MWTTINVSNVRKYYALIPIVLCMMSFIISAYVAWVKLQAPNYVKVVYVWPNSNYPSSRARGHCG